MVQISRFYRETLHERLKKRLEPSENDRVLEVGPSSRNPDYFSHRGPDWAELGHQEGWSRPGRGRVDSISHTNMETVGLGVLLV